MPEALVVDVLRTPLLDWEHGADDPVVLAATPLQGLLDRNGLAPTELHELVLGAGFGVDADLLARQVALAAGLPWHLPARTASRGDIGGLAALEVAVDMISAGRAEVVAVSGVAHPALRPQALGPRHTSLSPQVRWQHGLADPEAAARWWALQHGVGAAELVEVATQVFEARESSELAFELVPTERADGDWALEDPPLDGVSAGAPASVQGAACVLLASTERPDGPDLPARARVVGSQAGAVDLARTWGGSVVALRRLLAELVMNLEEIDLFVLDAPYAACFEAARRELGLSEEAVLPGLGHLALGRAPGVCGLRAIPDLLAALEARDLRYGAVLAESVDGQGACVLLDREVYF